MKNIMISCGLVLILVLTAVISLTIYSHNTRQNEVEDALTAAVEQALENLTVDKQYDIANKEEFIADFTQRLVLGLNSDSDILVNILAVDIKKGLLDVEVVETYRQLNGSVGKASYRKTVILDVVNEVGEGFHSVTFMVESGYATGSFKKYKEFIITEEENVIFPGAKPSLEGYKFLGWSLTAPAAENEYSPELASSMTADEDLVFYSVFAPK